MRKFLLGSFMLVLLAACSQTQEFMEPEQPEPIQSESGKVVHFSTRTITTRTSFGEAVTDSEGNVTYPCYWTENDHAVKISLNYEYALVAGVNAEETDDEGHITRSSFDASFSDIETSAPYSFYLVSPADAFLWASADRKAVSIAISANQTPMAASVDERAQVLVAKSDSYPSLPSNVLVDFQHITSYGKLTLTGITDNDNCPEDAALTSVSLICEEQPLSGSWYYSLSDGSISEREGSSSLVINTSGIDVTGGQPVWFAAAPVEMAGKKLTVRANFSNGIYLERTITLKDSFNFASGRIVKFSVNMKDAAKGENIVESSTEEEVYSRVTSVDQLSADDEVILVNSSSSPSYAMTGTTSGNGLAGTNSGFSVGSDGYIRLDDNTSVAKLTVGSRSGSSVTFKYGSSSYLHYTSSGITRSLSMSSSSTTWTMSISSGQASLSYTSGRTPYYIRFSGNAFSLTSTSSQIAIYKKTTVGSSSSVNLASDPVMEYSDFGAYLSDQNLIYSATTDQISREYSSDGSLLCFSIIAPAEDQVVEFSGIPADAGLGSKFSLGLKFISGIKTVIDKSFTVYVVKEEGHSLWLTDGSGNGFIVKR